MDRCIVSNFYIKSQHGLEVGQELVGCIVSNFYIKSQQIVMSTVAGGVV